MTCREAAKGAPASHFSHVVYTDVVHSLPALLRLSPHPPSTLCLLLGWFHCPCTFPLTTVPQFEITRRFRVGGEKCPQGCWGGRKPSLA